MTLRPSPDETPDPQPRDTETAGSHPTAEHVPQPESAAAKTQPHRATGTPVPTMLEETVTGSLRLAPSERVGSLGRLGTYEVLRHVGHGGMGVVVCAFDEKLHRTVAIKVMSPELMSSESARMRFFREARSAAGINHPNVVTIHAVDEHDGMPYLVMEFVEGCTLKDRINRRHPLDLHELLRIGSQIASGLAAAHKQGIIHRDIKPANVMLEVGVDRVKITDFGLARVPMDHSDLTSLGNVMGTPAYMSPEQVEGHALDARSDLFSFGIVLYAMVAGQSPFRAGNALVTARKIVSGEHRPLSEVCDNVPPYLADLIDRLLKKDPDQRPQTAAEVESLLIEQLANFNRNDSVALLLRREGTKRRRKASTRRSWGIATTLVVGAAAIAGLTTPLWRPQSRRATDASPQQVSERTARDSVAPQPSGTLRVAQDGSGDYESLSEALAAAGPGTVITVSDGATYREAIKLEGPRHDGVRLEAIGGGTLTDATSTRILTLSNVSDAVISGFRVEAQRVDQHGVEIVGECPGTKVVNCQVEALDPSTSGVSMVYVHNGAFGTEESPVLLKDLNVVCGGVGIVIGGGKEPEVVSSVRLENCRIQAVGKSRGVAVLLWGRGRNIQVTDNLIWNAQAGVRILFPAIDEGQDIEISNNSLYAIGDAIHLNVPIEQTGIRLTSNLFVDVDRFDFGMQDARDYKALFDDNWCVPGPNTNQTVIGAVADIKQTLSFVSQDPDHPDFLRPDSDAPPDVPGRLAPAY